jgi:hypothetical protein
LNKREKKLMAVARLRKTNESSKRGNDDSPDTAPSPKLLCPALKRKTLMVQTVMIKLPSHGSFHSNIRSTVRSGVSGPTGSLICFP